MYRQQHDPDVNVCENTQNSNKPIKEGTAFVLSDLTINNLAPDNCVAFGPQTCKSLNSCCPVKTH